MDEAITFTIRHPAPIRLRGRNGRDRIAFELAETPVRVRHVQPDSFETRRLTLGFGEPSEHLVRDGRIWVPTYVTGADGFARVGTLAEAVALLSTWTSPAPPAFVGVCTLHEGPLQHGRTWAAPLTPRERADCVESLGGIAADRMRRRADEDLVHDGRRLYAATDRAVLALSSSAGYVCLNWRTPGGWQPAVPLGRPDLVRPAIDAALSHADWTGDIARHQERRALEIATAFMGDNADLAGGRADLSAFLARVGATLLYRLPAMRRGDAPSQAEMDGLSAMVARASIDAVADADLHDAVATVERAATRMLAHPVKAVAREATRILAHVRKVAMPRLAAIPIPADELDGLAALAR